MIITFLGHRTLCNDVGLSPKLTNIIIQNKMPTEATQFYCGGYGDFDFLCAQVCQKIKETDSNCSLFLITPYITGQARLHSQSLAVSYDGIIYPPLELVPPKYAITKRNEWMINQADLIIAYVKYSYGGAYQALKYAKRRKKRIINLAEE